MILLLKKIFRFFFPKNFMQEIKRGIETGKNKPAEYAGGKLYDLGKKARKTIDPKHKMKIGKNKK